MRLPARIVIPVILAIVIVAAVLVVLFRELDGARAMLSNQLSIFTGSGLTNTPASIQNDINAGDETMLLLRTGDTFALRGEWDKAESEYRKAAEAEGGVTALRKLAQAQLQRRDVRGATETLDRMRREGARNEEVLLLESSIMLRTGELNKARQLLESSEESPHKHYGLALAAIVAGEHDAAKTELAAVVAGWDPVLRAYARNLAGAYEEYALFPSSPQIHLLTLLSRALAQVQECELSLPLLSEVTHEQDDYRDAWIVQGYCELTTERDTEALASLERAYQIDPEKPETQYFLARAYIDKGDHANALTFLQYALRNGFKPESEVRRLVAQEALETGNASLAFEQFDALTKMDDATIDAFEAYIAAAITAGKKEEAYAKATEAVGLWPDDASAHELLGWAADETGRTEEARTHLEKALELDPSLTSARERLEDL